MEEEEGRGREPLIIKRTQAHARAPFLSDRRAAMRTVVPPPLLRRMRDLPHPCPVLVLLPPSPLSSQARVSSSETGAAGGS